MKSYNLIFSSIATWSHYSLIIISVNLSPYYCHDIIDVYRISIEYQNTNLKSAPMVGEIYQSTNLKSANGWQSLKLKLKLIVH